MGRKEYQDHRATMGDQGIKVTKVLLPHTRSLNQDRRERGDTQVPMGNKGNQGHLVYLVDQVKQVSPGPRERPECLAGPE